MPTRIKLADGQFSLVEDPYTHVGDDDAVVAFVLRFVGLLRHGGIIRIRGAWTAPMATGTMRA